MIRAARTNAAQWSVYILAFSLLLMYPTAGTAADQNVLIAHYRNALQVDPDNLTLHYYLGVSLLIDGHDRAAVEAFTRAYPALADSMEMNYNFGLAWSRLGDPDSALIYLEQAEHLGINEEPGLYPLGEVYYNLALSYLQRGEDREALALFTRILQLNPGLTDVYRLRGDYYARKGDISRALEDFRHYQAIYPEEPTVREYLFSLLVNQGLQQLEAGQTDAAVLSFQDAAKAAEESPVPRYYLGFIAYQTGSYAEAVSALDSILQTATPEMQESIRAILYNSAVALEKSGDHAGAWQAIARVAARPEAATRELFVAGNICQQLQRFDRAIDFYRRILAQEPAHRHAAINLLAAETALLGETFTKGQKHFAAGEFATALPLFEQVLASNPAYPLAASYAAECQREMQRQAETSFALSARTFAEGNAPLALEQVRSGLTLASTDAGGLRLQEQILTSMTRDLEERQQLAAGLLAEGRHREARAAYRVILQLDPANPVALRELAQLDELARMATEVALTRARQALVDDDPLLAQELYRQLLTENPDDLRVQQGLAEAVAVSSEHAATEVRRGRDARAAGRSEESRRHLEAALRFQESPEIRQELEQLDADERRQASALLVAAREALLREDLKRSRSFLDKLRGSTPDSPELALVEEEYRVVTHRLSKGWLDTAQSQLAAKNYSQALAGFRRVLDLDPLNEAALKGLQQGKQQLQQELSRLVIWGNESLDRGDLSSAEGAFAEALALDPYLVAAKNGMDRLARLKQRGAKPGDDERLYLLGIENYTKGKYEDAVALWNQVLALNPHHEKARMNIEKARRKILQIKEYRRG